jgi:hypothetical protein
MHMLSYFSLRSNFGLSMLLRGSVRRSRDALGGRGHQPMSQKCPLNYPRVITKLQQSYPKVTPSDPAPRPRGVCEPQRLQQRGLSIKCGCGRPVGGTRVAAASGRRGDPAPRPRGVCEPQRLQQRGLSINERCGCGRPVGGTRVAAARGAGDPAPRPRGVCEPQRLQQRGLSINCGCGRPVGGTRVAAASGRRELPLV